MPLEKPSQNNEKSEAQEKSKVIGEGLSPKAQEFKVAIDQWINNLRFQGQQHAPGQEPSGPIMFVPDRDLGKRVNLFLEGLEDYSKDEWEALTALYERAAELAETVKIKCQLEESDKRPKGSEDARILNGKFLIDDNGEEMEKNFTFQQHWDEQEGFRGVSNDWEHPYPRSSRDEYHREVLKEWNDGDAKNILAEKAFVDAYRNFVERRPATSLGKAWEH